MGMMQAIPVAGQQPRTLARIGGVQQAEGAGQEVKSEQAVLSLTAYVRQCFDDAKSAKTSTVTLRLLACERQRRGEYDPDLKEEIQKTGGNEIYMMLTDIKCRAAAAWIKDVMINAGERTFALTPTTEPSLPEEVKREIIETVFAEVSQLAQAGMPVMQQAVDIRMDELLQQVKEETKARADSAAMRMEDRIQDILEEGGWRKTLEDLIDDFVTFPTAIFKGPFVGRKPGMVWGPNWTPQVTVTPKRQFRRVSPYNAFPSPGATSINDGFFCERHILNRQELQSFIGAPGYNSKEIKEVLERFDDKHVRSWISGDDEKDRLDGKSHTWYSRNQIEAIEFWGPVSGLRLMEWGMKGLDPYKDYEANVWLIANYTIRAVLNPDPLGRRPYSTSSFVPIPDSFWGKALPELMRDVQRMCNAAARALANNMSLASGPMVEIAIDRLPPGEKVESIYPWKIYQTTSDKTGGGQPAVRFFQPNMNTEQLLAVYTYFQKVADEVTGVPNYVYGSTQVGGAGRTASGLSMLMENAAKGIKNAILDLDAAQSAMINRVFESLMIYDPDSSIKGDMTVVPAGIVATLIKEGAQERRVQFLQATANPFDAQIMGPSGRAAVLRKVAKSLDMDVDDVIPDPRILKQQEQEQKAMQAMALQQSQQPQQPPDQQPMPMQ